MIITHQGPRNLFRRRNKNFSSKEKSRKFGKKGNRQDQRSRNKIQRRTNKYMSHVLSYINEEEQSYETQLLNLTFDLMHTIFQESGKEFVKASFHSKTIAKVCLQEFKTNIGPNLQGHRFARVSPGKLFTWISMTEVDVDDVEPSILEFHNSVKLFSLPELSTLNEIFQQWDKFQDYARSLDEENDEINFGIKCNMPLEECNTFVNLCNKHNLRRKWTALSDVLGFATDDRSQDECSLKMLFCVVRPSYDEISNCRECGRSHWTQEVMSYVSICDPDHNQSICLACSVSTVKTLKENDTEHVFCDPDKFILPITRRNGESFFAKELGMTIMEVKERFALDFERVVMKRMLQISDQMLAKPNQRKQLLKLNDELWSVHTDSIAISEEKRKEFKDSYEKNREVYNMLEVKPHLEKLDAAVDELHATFFKDEEQMLEACSKLQTPIRNVLLRRVPNTKSYPELFSLSSYDVCNMKLERAKNALKVAYALARTCSICMTTSKRTDEEELLALHNCLETSVEKWRYNGYEAANAAFRLPCFACKDCLCNYLNFKKEYGKPALKCPGMNCGCLLKRSALKALVPEAYEQYSQALLRFSLKKVNNFRTCPVADCAASIVVDIDCSAHKIGCPSCKHEFCPSCNDTPHEGMTCEEMAQKRHKEKWGDSKEYMKNETKQCPWCLVWIEKNGGCNHMTCHNCTGEFCWLCFGDWEKHTECHVASEKVVRRPFKELFPDWLSKPKKTLKPRFHVGRYVTFNSTLARVQTISEHGMYVIEPVNGSFLGTMAVEETLLRGFNGVVPTPDEDTEDSQSAYRSFLSGFDESSPASLTLTSGSDVKCSKAHSVAITEEELGYASFISGFDCDEEEESEHEMYGRETIEIMLGCLFRTLDTKSSQLVHATKLLKSLKQRRIARATREKVREVFDQDSESFAAHSKWLFPSDSDSESSCSDLE